MDITSFMSRKDVCNVCRKVVKQRQEAIQCDICEKWVRTYEHFNISGTPVTYVAAPRKYGLHHIRRPILPEFRFLDDVVFPHNGQKQAT